MPERRVVDAPSRDRREPEAPVDLYPSDLTWLRSSCRRCFYLKAKHGVWPPGGPMPGIFRAIDRAIRDYCLQTQRTELVCPQMPPGRFVAGETRVASRVLQMFGHSQRVRLCGKPDALVLWDNGTYGIIDFKTTQVKENTANFYELQLEQYARCLELPETGAPRRVGDSGLLVFEPELFTQSGAERIALDGGLRWVPVSRMGVAYDYALSDILADLELSTPPEPSASCQVCLHHAQAALALGANPHS